MAIYVSSSEEIENTVFYYVLLLNSVKYQREGVLIIYFQDAENDAGDIDVNRGR